ncbi:outer membrane beta-barrel protein [Mucilaginibacter xinganensis]|uniref:Outer membrane protein beta-barrel domain-containing protein n=1 Tax=Mucilaginibacter xinganensis TaxID=1234841 RepID=A0A223P0K8_9SPHI|nr:outer membrane beta-barrel protein [Mucilaginibacter xinganensis]ASU35371.1 hypothetical protein MuYL_3486 [Mucilaginibacter xinganensis]
MKQKLLALSIFIIAGLSAATAQTHKGEYYLGGSLSYDYSSYGSSTTYSFTEGYTIYTTSKISSFSFRPEFGFFISDKWSIGIQPVYSRQAGTETSDYHSYTNTSNNYTSSDKYHNDVLGIGVHARYYAMISDKFGFFPEFGISTINNTTYFKYGTFSLGGTPNFVFFPTPKLGVNLGFGGVSYNLDYQTKDSTFHLGLNDNISFGLNYFWGRK